MYTEIIVTTVLVFLLSAVALVCTAIIQKALENISDAIFEYVNTIKFIYHEKNN